MNISSKTHSQFTLIDSEFPKEFARFVGFIGGDALTEAAYRVIRKLASYSHPVRSLFGDRFFFHEQWLRFIDAGFQLDAADPVAVRTASLIAGINRVQASLSTKASLRFRNMIVGILRPDQDVRQLEHEIRCYTHFRQKGYKVAFADLEELGAFDLLLEAPPTAIENECKTISQETGSQIKMQMTANLVEKFRRIVLKTPVLAESGILVLALRKPAQNCRNLTQKFETALRSFQNGYFEDNDFTVTFLPRPQWTALNEGNRKEELRQLIESDTEIAGHARFVTKTGVSGAIVGLSIRPHRPSELRQSVIEVLKGAADQCTGQRPALVWLHFIDIPEAEFMTLAQLSMDGRGAGLNSLVASVVHPQITASDRSHVHTVRFSVTSRNITKKPILSPNLLLTQAASIGGSCYDVPNPFCRFPSTMDV